MTEPIIQLGPLQVALILVLAAIPIAISLKLRLGLVGEISIATVRSIVQLVAIGLVIGWVFDQRTWYWVLALVALMTLVAGQVGARRTEVKLKRLSGLFSLVLGGVTAITVLYLVEVILGQRMVGVAEWNPRYIIPLAGILLGNAMTGGSLAVERLVSDLKRQSHHIETMLALGASPAQATHALLRSAIRTSMVPTLNTMMIVGIVQLPGMMTGQMLAGAEPLQAALYQFLILVAIAFSTVMSATLLLFLLYRRFFTPAWQLRRALLERLSDK